MNVMEHDQNSEVISYMAPDFEVVEIEIEQNILAGSTPDFDGEDWG